MKAVLVYRRGAIRECYEVASGRSSGKWNVRFLPVADWKRFEFRTEVEVHFAMLANVTRKGASQ